MSISKFVYDINRRQLILAVISNEKCKVFGIQEFRENGNTKLGIMGLDVCITYVNLIVIKTTNLILKNKRMISVY
jgi:hypothetical protein